MAFSRDTKAKDFFWDAVGLGMIGAWLALPLYWTFNDAGPARWLADLFFLTGHVSNFAVYVSLSVLMLIAFVPVERFMPKKPTRARPRTEADETVWDDVAFPAVLTAIGLGMGLWLYAGGVAPDLGRVTPSEALAERGNFWGEVIARIDTSRAVTEDGQTYVPLLEVEPSPPSVERNRLTDARVACFASLDFTTKGSVLGSAKPDGTVVGARDRGRLGRRRRAAASRRSASLRPREGRVSAVEPAGPAPRRGGRAGGVPRVRAADLRAERARAGEADPAGLTG